MNPPKQSLTCGQIWIGFIVLAVLAGATLASNATLSGFLVLAACSELSLGGLAWALGRFQKADDEGRGMFNPLSRPQRQTQADLQTWLRQPQVSVSFAADGLPLPPAPAFPEDTREYEVGNATFKVYVMARNRSEARRQFLDRYGGDPRSVMISAPRDS